MSTKETQELFALAQKNKLFIMEAIWSRFLPSYEFVFDQIKKGVIGDILYVDATFGVMIENVERVAKKELGGGTILDLGVYTINIVEQVFNGEMPEKISAVGNLNANGVDLNCSAVLKFKNGRTATISTHSQIVLPNEAHIVGTKGTIKVLILNSFYSAKETFIKNNFYKDLKKAKRFRVNLYSFSGLKIDI